MNREIPNTNCIGIYIRCGKCLEELPPNTSPQEYARLAVGQTIYGIQVWCTRHDCNICHVDFLENKLPANLTAQPKDEPALDNVVHVDFRKKS